MNDEHKQQNSETPAPESEREAQTMDPTPAAKPENGVEASEQSPVQPTRPGEPDPKPGIELVKPETLVDGDLPEPSEHVIREHVPGIAQTPKRDTPETGQKVRTGEAVRMPDSLEKTERGWRDPSGRYFDPKKHQHTNGLPKTSDKGYFRPWGRIHHKAGLPEKPEGFGDGEPEDEAEPRESFLNKAKRLVFGEREPEAERHPETRDPAPEATPQSAQGPQFANGGVIGAPQPPQAPETGKSTEAATAAAQLVAMEEMIAVMIFSEEWQFLSEERKGLVMAWTRSFEEKGIVETPWWMELGAAHAVIIANRADKPKTREKLGKMKASFMKKMIDLRTARAPAQAEPRKEVE